MTPQAVVLVFITKIAAVYRIDFRTNFDTQYDSAGETDTILLTGTRESLLQTGTREKVLQTGGQQ